MKVFTTDKSEKELSKLPRSIYFKFMDYFNILEKEKTLSKKFFKKLSGNNLYEFRVKEESGIYRGLAGKVKPNLLVVLFFHKKTQKTPQKEIKTALNRLRSL